MLRGCVGSPWSAQAPGGAAARRLAHDFDVQSLDEHGDAPAGVGVADAEVMEAAPWRRVTRPALPTRLRRSCLSPTLTNEGDRLAFSRAEIEVGRVQSDFEIAHNLGRSYQPGTELGQIEPLHQSQQRPGLLDGDPQQKVESHQPREPTEWRGARRLGHGAQTSPIARIV